MRQWQQCKKIYVKQNWSKTTKGIGWVCVREREKSFGKKKAEKMRGKAFISFCIIFCHCVVVSDINILTFVAKNDLRQTQYNRYYCLQWMWVRVRTVYVCVCVCIVAYFETECNCTMNTECNVCRDVKPEIKHQQAHRNGNFNETSKLNFEHKNGAQQLQWNGSGICSNKWEEKR